MIHSQFISDILDLLLDGDKNGMYLRNQLPFLTDNEYDYTGSGVFVSFTNSDEIHAFQLSNNIIVINGVIIKSAELESGAETTLFIKNGLVDCLEIWSYSGDYPGKDLASYIMIQTWDNSPKRQIHRP